MKNFVKLMGLLGVLASALFLSGCEGYDIINPAGYVASEQRVLIFICVGVMLCVVIPVMIAVVLFAIKYRSTNTSAEYLPDWGHSNKIECFMWGVPILIIIVLGSMTAYFTWKLEPSKPIGGEKAELQIDAVAMDWKWLFIYPQYNVASINEIYAPVNKQVLLQLSSEQSVNAFWVPRLGSLLYAMPQMNGKLHLIANEEGKFYGSSGNYSGDGFAYMHFYWNSVSQEKFDAWIANARQVGTPLGQKEYLALAVPPHMGDIPAKEKDAEIRYFSPVEQINGRSLYYRVVNRCVAEGVTEGVVCNEQLMAKNAVDSLWGQLCSVFDASYVSKN